LVGAFLFQFGQFSALKWAKGYGPLSRDVHAHGAVEGNAVAGGPDFEHGVSTFRFGLPKQGRPNAMPMALWMNEQFFNSASGESYETDNSAIDLSNVAGVCVRISEQSYHAFRK
jgi:hypothetical protein